MPSFKKFPYIGIDVGGTNMSAAIVDENNCPVFSIRSKTRAHLGHKSVLSRIGEMVRVIRDKVGLSQKQIAGLGIGVPGPVDIHKGMVIDAPNLGWKHLEIRNAVKDLTGLPTVLDNDVNLALYGEVKAGSATGCNNVLGIWTGTGVGGALVLSNNLYHGQHYTAGEIGHTIVLTGAGLGRETLEDLGSRTAIVRTIKHLLQSSHPSLINELVKGNHTKIKSKVVAKAVLSGDSLATRVVQDAARYTGIVAANMVTTLSLSCVVLGGGMATALGAPWAEWVSQSLDEYIWPKSFPKVKTVIAGLGDNSGTVGAAIAAREGCKSI